MVVLNSVRLVQLIKLSKEGTSRKMIQRFHMGEEHSGAYMSYGGFCFFPLNDMEVTLEDFEQRNKSDFPNRLTHDAISKIMQVFRVKKKNTLAYYIK